MDRSELSLFHMNPCYCCGKEGHEPHSCGFQETIFHHCKKRGHLARVCRFKTLSVTGASGKASWRPKKGKTGPVKWLDVSVEKDAQTTQDCTTVQLQLGETLLPCLLWDQGHSLTSVNLNQETLPIYLHYNSYGLTWRSSQSHNDMFLCLWCSRHTLLKLWMYWGWWWCRWSMESMSTHTSCMYLRETNLDCWNGSGWRPCDWTGSPWE